MNRKRAPPRKYISLREKLAAALSMLLPQEQRDDLRERKVPAKIVISLFHQDHGILHAHDGADKWWNLTPMLVGPHKEKSKIDTAIAAKVKRVSAAEEEFRRKLLAKTPGQKRKRKATIRNRGFAKCYRPLRPQ